MFSVPAGDPHTAMAMLCAQMNAEFAALEARVALLESIAPKKAMEKAQADASGDDKS